MWSPGARGRAGGWGPRGPDYAHPPIHGAVGTHEILELDTSFTSLFPELEAGWGAVSQLADLPFLP